MTRRYPIALAVLLLPGGIFALPSHLMEEEMPEGLEDFRRGRIEKSPFPPISAGIRNPSFETLDGNGRPVDWAVQGVPELRTGGAFNGINYGRVASGHEYRQSFALDIPTWETVSFGSRFRSDFGQDVAMHYSESSGPSQIDLAFQLITRSGFNPGSWEPMYSAFTKISGAQEMVFFATTRSNVYWLDVDDIFLVFEAPANGGFESIDTNALGRRGWALSGSASFTSIGAISGTRSLSISASGIAEQFVAHAPDVARYFVAGRASGEFTLQELRYNTSTLLPAESFSGLVVPSGGTFFVELPKSDGGEIARLRLFAATNRLVDDLTRGWAYAFPEQFDPVPNSPRPTTRLTAAWPGNLDDATIVIRDSADQVVDTITTYQRDQTTIWIEYDGNALPEGVYTAEFQLTGLDGLSISPRREFSIRRSVSFPEEVTPLRFSDFKSVAWLFQLGNNPEERVTSVERAAELIQSPIDDGFNTILYYGTPSEVPFFQQALADNGVPFIFGINAIDVRSIRFRGHSTYEPDRHRAVVDQYQSIWSLPNCIGIYIADEPNLSPSTMQRANRSFRYLEGLGNYPPTYSIQKIGSPIIAVESPLVSTYDYPILPDGNNPNAAILASTLELEANSVIPANANDKDFWITVQSFATIAFQPPMTEQETMFQLAGGLAIGARGYVTFLYSSLNLFAGLRTPDQSETPRLAAYQEFNSRIDNIDGLLSTISTTRTAPPQSNILARIGASTDGNSYLFVVNPQTRQSNQVTVTTNIATSLTDVETNISTAASTSHNLALPAAQWAILRIPAGASVMNVAGVPDPENPDPTVSPVLIGEINVGASPRFIALSPDGQRLAVNQSSLLRLYSTGSGNFGTLLDSRTVSPGIGRVRFQNNTTLFASRQPIEYNVYTVASNLTDFARINRRTNVGVDALLANDGRIVTSRTFLGAGIWNPIGNTDSSLTGFFFPGYGSFAGVFGPFSGDRYIIIDSVLGPWRFDLNNPQGPADLYANSGRYHYGALSPSGRLAVGNFDLGVELFFLDANGASTLRNRVGYGDLTGALDTAWLGNNLLAVADWRSGVAFYQIDTAGEGTLLGLWKPTADPFLVHSLTSNGVDTVAVLTNDGIVRVVDCTNLLEIVSIQDWMNY